MSPGHVFPLVAREGGVLIRAGHTEASVDLARLAGLYPAAVICEIMNDDGTMARVPDLIPFALQHGLKIGTIDDLIGYRLRNDRIVKRVGRSPVESAFGGGFELHVYEPTVEAGEHLALVKGDLKKPGPVLVRVHAVNVLSDCMGIGDGSNSSIANAMQAIEAAGRGVIVLIRDLRPNSVSEWIAAPRRRRFEREGRARSPPGRNRRRVANSARPRRQGNDAAHELAGACLRRRRGVRPQDRRHPRDLKTMTTRPSRPTVSMSRPTQTRSRARVLIIEARFYENISDELAAGAVAELEAMGASYERVVVPGALEIPQVLAQAAAAGIIPRSAPSSRYCGAVALGCVIRGETSHYDIVCNNANHWMMEVAIRHSIPVGNGILTVDTEEQAMARARGGREGKGGDAVRACLRLIELSRAFQGQGA